MRSSARHFVRALPMLALGLCLALAVGPGARPVAAVSANIVISQVYGGGGNSGATYTHDFIELFNRSAAAVSVDGWSVQYAASTGAAWQATPLSGTVAAGGYYLVQQAAGAGGTTPLPTPEASGSIALAATAGKVAVVSSTDPLAGTCPASPSLVDLVGYGSAANCYEGSGPTGSTSNTTAALRSADGATDTDDNSADFSVGAPTPRNSADPAPTVAATTPNNGAAGVALDASLVVVFSEPVNVTTGWASVSCASTGAHSVSASGGPLTFTLDPDTDFGLFELCTVTVAGALVSDQDSADPHDTMTADYVFSFTTLDPIVCGDSATLISTIQGSGLASPLAGSVVEVEGVVVGDYQDTGAGLGGFFIQEEANDADGNPATSEGLFVADAGLGVDVQPGHRVRAKGTVDEQFGLTALSAVRSVQVCASATTPAPASLSLPVAVVTDLEAYEGMLVALLQDLRVTDTFNLGRFGEVGLAAQGRLYHPTSLVQPGAAAVVQQALNDRRRILLDDGSNLQNSDPTRYPSGGLSAANTLRTGDTLASLTGVLDYRFGVYRVQPVGGLDFAPANPRPAAPPPVGGTLRVAVMNVLNYFNGNGLGAGFPTARGAESQLELDRQHAKLVSALLGLEADIVGLVEIENDAGANSALEALVAGLNAATAAGTYASIDTGVIGTDAIRVALIYRPARATPVGDFAVLTSAVDVRFDDTRNRPALAQTFEANGSRLTVVVNHLKSKGSACSGDPDTGDGQGNCSLTRTAAAAALADWLASDPTGSGDPDYLILGDLNAYAREDPIELLVEAGYTNLIDLFAGATAYSYVFEGQAGYLDHALASAALTAQVTGAAEWHVNADEPTVLDYNTNNKTANQLGTLYAPDAYRASDHDPLLVGLALNEAPSVAANGPYTVNEGLNVNVSATGSDPNGDSLTYAWDLDHDGTYETPGQDAAFSALALDGPTTATLGVQASDGTLTATAAALVSVVNAAPSVGGFTFDPAPAQALAAVTVSGVFTDAAADAPFTCTVDYGAGPAAGVVSGSVCTGATHRYSTAGSVSVTVTVTDKDGATGSRSEPVMVAPAAYTLHLPVVLGGAAGQAQGPSHRPRVRAR